MSDGILNKNKQKTLVPDKGHTSKGNGKYDPKLYPKLAYEVLSKKHLQSLTHLSDALNCTTEAITQWRKKYPEFNEMIVKGLAAGERKFRDKLQDHAFKPQSEVNNGLIKLLAGNVYGIREETPQVIINNTNTLSPEKALKDRGIPIPEIAVEDVEDVDDECLECGACDEPDKENCPANQG